MMTTTRPQPGEPDDTMQNRNEAVLQWLQQAAVSAAKHKPRTAETKAEAECRQLLLDELQTLSAIFAGDLVISRTRPLAAKVCESLGCCQQQCVVLRDHGRPA